METKKEISDFTLTEILDEARSRIESKKISKEELQRFDEIFEILYEKTSGLKMPETSRATRRANFGFTGPTFMRDLQQQLMEEDKLSNASRTLTKLWGIYLMRHYPEEWRELAGEYEK